MTVLVALTQPALEMHAAPEPADRDIPLSETNQMFVGVDYYPEHWPEERWNTDFRLMREADFNVVRIGEFAWAKLEPGEGKFEFDWLKRALDEAHAQGIQVILGTPTAVMPAWLARRYPEALAMKADGTRIVWGGRRHNCFSDQAYKRLSERIVRKLGEQCGSHPAVIGWQPDNELGGTDCRCEKCRLGFQDWLRKQYGTLNELNRAWGNHFWGLQIGEWDEIPIPDDRTGSWSISNPSASLDWQRYTSDLNIDFLNSQLRILKGCCPPKHFYTHNLMGLYPRVNYYKLAKELDFVSWDNYPWLSPSLPYKSALAGDLMRGLKAKNYWIMEQTAGPLGWDEFSTTPLPGELRKICYQQLAHGCDALVWFRWRTCTAGREQYWHGLLGHDGVPGRRYREAAKFAKECRALQDKLIGTTLKPQVAIIYDYDSLWALEIQEGYPGASYREAISRYYDALLRLGVNVDLIPPSADLDKYSLVIAPHLHILPDLIADRIDQYVQKGGTLLTDCRTGVKDPTNLAYPRTLPGKLSTALGITIPEYESTSVGMRAPATREYAIHSEQFGRGFTATKYVDWVSPTTATTIASYDKQSHLIDFAAVTRNEHGSGSAWYVGTIAKEDSFYDTLIAQVAKDAGVRPILDPPKGVEVSLRQGNGQRLLFVINHANSATTIDSVPTGAIDLLSEELPNGSVTLEPFGVAIYSLPPSKVDDSTTR